MDLLTWTRKGKDSNIYYIYTYIRYILIGMLPKSQKSGEFVGTFLLLLLLTTTVVIVFVCVCVYPCKQFVVVGTIRRTDSWNTIPTYLTLPYLTHLFHRTLTRSTGIHHRFIVWFLERTIILEDKKVPFGTNFKLARELIGIDYYSIQSNSASTVAALLNDIFTLVVVVVVVVIIRKAEAKPNQTEYIDLQGGSSPFFTIKTSHQYQEEEEGEDIKTTSSTSKP